MAEGQTSSHSSPNLSQQVKHSFRRFSLTSAMPTKTSPKTTNRHRSTNQPLSDGEDGPALDHPPRVSFKEETHQKKGASSRLGSDATEDDEKWSKKTGLSLDGGGIRGLCQLYILKELMHCIKNVEQRGEHPNYSSVSNPFLKKYGELYERIPGISSTVDDRRYLPCHYFDYFGGTSTGGIIAILLGRLRLDIETAVIRYQVIWTQMALGMSLMDRLSPIRKGRKANTQSVQDAMEKIVSEEGRASRRHASSSRTASFVSDETVSRTLVLAVEINKENGERSPYLFRSYHYDAEHPSGLNRRQDPVLDESDISLVASATSAAPTYFSSVRIRGSKSTFRDGTLWALNPSMELYREIKSLHASKSQLKPIDTIVSIGSGKISPAGRMRSFRRRRNSLTTDEHPEQLEVDSVLSERSKDEELGYFRFDGPSDLSGLNIDEWKDDRSGKRTFERIQQSVSKYCQSPNVKRDLEACAERMVAFRHNRANTGRWEHFALGVYYTCDLCGRGKHRRFKPKQDLNLDRTVSNESDKRDLLIAAAYRKSSASPLSRTMSSVSSVLAMERTSSTPRSLSVASVNESSYVSNATHDVIETMFVNKDFDSREDFIEHLMFEHEAPPPDVYWEPIINKYVVDHAHTRSGLNKTGTDSSVAS